MRGHRLRGQHRGAVRVLAHGRPMHIRVVIRSRVQTVRRSGAHLPRAAASAALHEGAITQRIGRRHPLLLLPSVAEPYPDDFLF